MTAGNSPPESTGERTPATPQRPDDAKLMKALAAMLMEMGGQGVDTDQLPGASGEFGLSAENPIPTKGIGGAMQYLSSLRTTDGKPVAARRLCTARSVVSPRPVDAYEVRDPSGQVRVTLFLAPYNRRNSGLVPAGFTFAEPEHTAPAKGT